MDSLPTVENDEEHSSIVFRLTSVATYHLARAALTKKRRVATTT
jgi:hypothetical protein